MTPPPATARRRAQAGHVALAAWVLTLIALGVWYFSRPRYPVAEDKRHAVRLSADAREAVLGEMRGMLAPLLPDGWRALGAATHQAFDSLATRAGASPREVSARLARITANCVTCHASYRLDGR